jgi:protein TonB
LRLPFAVSLAGHAIGFSLLVWLTARLPPLAFAPPAPERPVAVIFEAPPAPKPPPPKLLPAPKPPPPVVVKPPPPPPPPPKVIEAPKPPPVVRHIEPKPKPKPRPARRRIERRVRHAERPRRVIERPPPPRHVPQTAALPPLPQRRPPPAAPIISGAYRGALAEWFAAHRHYPVSARERGEEGTGVLRIRVDRSGRVLSHTLVRSSGYPDLDQAIDETMRGAVLPPFPADMAANENEVTVTIPFRFRIEH